MTAELRRAEDKHPGWPEDDLLRQVMIVSEEMGEVQKAALELIEMSEETGVNARAYIYKANEIDKEMVQVAAMAIRFLLHREQFILHRDDNATPGSEQTPS